MLVLERVREATGIHEQARSVHLDLNLKGAT